MKTAHTDGFTLPSSLSLSLIHALSVGMSPPAVLVWYYPPTMSTSSRQTWVMWCCSSSVSTEVQCYFLLLNSNTKKIWKQMADCIQMYSIMQVWHLFLILFASNIVCSLMWVLHKTAMYQSQQLSWSCHAAQSNYSGLKSKTLFILHMSFFLFCKLTSL